MLWNNSTKTFSCDLCAAGRHTPNASQTFCILCPPGRHQAQKGMPFCTYCSPGQYQNSFGAQECIDCQEKTFSNVLGATSCAGCKLGQFSFKGSFTCSSCILGQYGSEPGVCDICPEGKYQNERKQIECKECPPGKLSQNNVGGSFICKRAYFTPEECNARSYLNDSSTDKRDWKCVQW